MSIDDFGRYSQVLIGLTGDFVRAVPEDKWDFTPDSPGSPAAHRPRIGLATASRHFPSNCGTWCCVRGVCNAALATGKVDWTRKHDHYVGPLTRPALLAALDEKQRQLLATPRNRRHRRVDRLGTERLSRLPFSPGSSSRSVEHLCFARGVRHAAQLAHVMGLVKQLAKRWAGVARRQTAFNRGMNRSSDSRWDRLAPR